MGLLGILVALGFLIWLSYRGWSILLLAPAAAIVASAFAREPLHDRALGLSSRHAGGRSRRCDGHVRRCQPVCRLLRAGADGAGTISGGRYTPPADARRDRARHINVYDV